MEGQSGILVIVGSDSAAARAQLERLAEEGALTLTLTREAVLGQDETLLMALRSMAGAAVSAGRVVIVRSENWPGAVEMTRRMAAKRYIPAVEERVATMLARVAEGVVKAGAADRLIVVGTDTGEAVCRQLQISEREAIGEVAPGLAVLRVQSELLRSPVGVARSRRGEPGAGGSPNGTGDALTQVETDRSPGGAGTAQSPVGPLFLVLKPGSHGEPESLLQAVAALATVELA